MSEGRWLCKEIIVGYMELTVKLCADIFAFLVGRLVSLLAEIEQSETEFSETEYSDTEHSETEHSSMETLKDVFNRY